MRRLYESKIDSQLFSISNTITYNGAKYKIRREMHGPAVTLSIYHAEDQIRKVLTQLDIVASVSGEELNPR